MRKKRILLVLLITFLISTSIVSIGQAADDKIIYVDSDNTQGAWTGTPEHPYQYIQDAINVANAGDTVFVYSGTYVENIIVDKPIKLIGENKESTIIDGSRNGDVVQFISDGVSISKFTLQNGGYAGVYTKSYNDNIISQNIIKDCRHGIYIGPKSDNNIIKNNIISQNRIMGIYIGAWSDNNIITENTIKDCEQSLITGRGITIYFSDYNIIYHNNFINNNPQARDEIAGKINTWYSDTLHEGNYWDDYTGTDSNGDGIGDTPYQISGSAESKDMYPLMQPWKSNKPPVVTIESVIQPFSDFILLNDEIGLSGSFTDPDGGTHAIKWDFGDGNLDNGEFVTTHTYTEPGEYTVTLTVTDDDNGMGSASIVVVVKSHIEAIEDVLKDIEEMNLPDGIKNSLISKLENAIDLLSNCQTNAAINNLNAFINHVEAQRGKKLADEEADGLIAAIQWIINNISYE